MAHRTVIEAARWVMAWQDGPPGACVQLWHADAADAVLVIGGAPAAGVWADFRALADNQVATHAYCVGLLRGLSAGPGERGQTTRHE
ncbi:hypothetical protein EV659_1197 [Rhodothalassium salexigens DSM 2132]|uniref:Uncharacterized protein n=1 Tax=Rhodothalassium salexigens DSM 2132 TaxID=1188247 RepID=A0A4V2SN22_RHOSA|nr:hypothetical protein [Rhodothalassium salexigens]MBB4212808.1 hypothetical protein [Rhodothalassium salexigens DSM 2132]MBK1638949.1 hypothetical protein [Rhodothalassium salexigens DSM 2132]TCP29546.1 hypothetical protein EV659_1197 [Rhodothalassium salexigens DSM 2132]